MKKQNKGIKSKLEFFGHNYSILKSSIYAYNKAKHGAEIELNRQISNLKYTCKLKTNDLISDLRYFQKNKFSTWIDKIKGKALIRCIIHMDNGNDLVRFFPIFRNNVVNILDEYYIFSPDSIRYINGIPTLYFYHGVPFSILHKIKENIPTLDAKAFTSVQRSKFITDALEGADNKLSGGLLIAIIILVILNIVAVIIAFASIFEKLKKAGIA